MGSKSNSTATTTQNEYFDNRQVVDAGGGIVGTGNSVDSSQTWQQSTADNRTNNNSGNTSWTSDSSQTWTQNTSQADSSSKSYSNSGNTTWTSTDGGAFKVVSDTGLAQTAMVGTLAKIAADSASNATAAGLQAQQAAITASGTANANALSFVGSKFDQLTGLAASLVTGAQKQADSAAGTVQAAYTSAASQANGNKTLTIAALAVVGALGVAFLIKR